MAGLVAIDDIPTLPLLYKTKWIQAVDRPVHPPRPEINAKIAVIRHDITRLQVDSIVNAANQSLLGGGGVDGAIHRAAGPRLLAECETLDGCDTGSAKITDGYRLPCKRVIHAVGPIYFREKGRGQHEVLLRGCYRKSLELCEQHELKSVAFSALSTGIYGYPSHEAADAAISEVRRFFDEGRGRGIEKVVFCNFMEKDEKAYQSTLGKYFPHADDVTKTGESSKTADDKTRATKTAAASSGSTQTKAKSHEDSEPSAKKIKTSATEDDVNDDDWVDVDKSAIPHKVTVEDAEDSGR